jgi:hypothetical protein
VGRQLINYNNTIIANSEWRNQARSYDAAVLNLNAKREHLGLFAASAVAPQAYGVSPHQEGNNIYGAYGRIDDFLVPHSNLEPFLLWRVQPKEVVEPAAGKTTGKENEKAFGVRFKAQARTALDYGGEVILETGKVGAQSIRASAAQAGAAYQFLNVATKPRIFTQFDYATGNSNPAKNATHTTFDTIFPTAHDRFGISDLFGGQNIESVRAGTTIEPHRRLSFTVQGLDFWAADALDSIYNSSGSAIVTNKTDHGLHLGAEIDGYSWYELNRHFNLGGGIGYFGAGQFLTNVSTSHTYTTYYFALNFKDALLDFREQARVMNDRSDRYRLRKSHLRATAAAARIREMLLREGSAGKGINLDCFCPKLLIASESTWFASPKTVPVVACRFHPTGAWLVSDSPFVTHQKTHPS